MGMGRTTMCEYERTDTAEVVLVVVGKHDTVATDSIEGQGQDMWNIPPSRLSCFIINHIGCLWVCVCLDSVVFFALWQ